MKINIFKISVIFLTILTLSSQALADVKAYIQVHTEETPKDVTGLLIYPNEVKELAGAEINYINTTKDYVVSFNLSDKVLNNRDVLIGAVVTTVNGKTVFGNIKNIPSALVPPVTEVCEESLPPAISQKASADNIKRFMSVIQLRQSRLETSRNNFKKALQEKITKKFTLEMLINKFSIGFLGEELDLTSNETPALKIVYSLYRLEQALKAHEEKQKKEAERRKK